MRIRTSTMMITLGATAFTVGLGSTGVLAGTTDVLAPAPPRTIGGLTTPSPQPQPATTCEGNVSCGVLRVACALAGGTYSGWDSSDRGHDHEHGICTWPWE